MPTNNVQLKRGTAAAFANVTTKDPNTIYFITDTNRIYVGDSEYSRPVLYSAEAPSETMPKGTLYIREITENSIIRQQLYYSNGSTWNPVSAEPGDILAEAITAGNDGDVIPNAAATTFEVPTITVDTKGRVSDVVERTIDLVNFMPKSGGTFSGDVTISGDLTTGSITPINHNIEIQTIFNDDVNDPDDYYARLIFKDNSENAVSNVAAYIDGDFFPDGTEGRQSSLTLRADNIELYGDTSIYGNSEVYGNISCISGPTESNHLTKKSYVDNAIASAISASDAMVFKGTVGTSGTVASISVMDYSTAATGDTYKVITTDTLPAANSSDSSEHDLTPGDLIVYMGESKFIYVPSGDEDVTSVKVAGSGDTINVSTTAQTGTVVLGDVATKNVSTSTTLNGNGASNDNVATELAVKTYVDDTVGALENTLGTAATTNATDYATAAQGTLADNAMPKSGGTFTGDVTVSGELFTNNINASTSGTITIGTSDVIEEEWTSTSQTKIVFCNSNDDKYNNGTATQAKINVDYEDTYGPGGNEHSSSISLSSDYFSIHANQINFQYPPLIYDGYGPGMNGIEGEGVPATTASREYVQQTAMLKSGGTFTGAVTLAGAPTTDLNAATKKYVDDTVAAATLTWKTF